MAADRRPPQPQPQPQAPAPAPAQDRLDRAIRHGLLALAHRRLQFAPQPDLLGQVAAVWLADLRAAGLGDVDAPVIEAAMHTLGRSQRDWPQPCQIIEAVRAAARHPPMGAALPPPLDAAATAQARACLRQLRCGLAAAWVPPDHLDSQ
jgi:hypothetical protein